MAEEKLSQKVQVVDRADETKIDRANSDIIALLSNSGRYTKRLPAAVLSAFILSSALKPRQDGNYHS
jgi:hypothetical protein